MPGYTPDSSVVRALTPDLEQYYLLRTNSSPDAADLVQETWAAVTNFRAESSLRYYLFAIARRLVAGWYRQRYRRPYMHLDDIEPTLGSDPFINQETTPGSRLQSLADLRRLHCAIDTLEQPYRETMRLHLDGLESAEIARRLGIEANTVRSRLARARKALRARMVGEK